MHALPLLVAFLLAAILAPGMLRTLAEAGQVRLNYRERGLPCPFGVLIVAAALLALLPLLLIERLGDVEVIYPGLLPTGMYALGVACLGLIDDTLGLPRPDLRAASGSRAPRGWRGHARAALRGELSTGTLKAAGTLGLALLLMDVGRPTDHWLVAGLVLALATNLFNLLDLRPGRSIKVFVLLGAGLTAGLMDFRPLWLLGVFVGPALVAGVYDLRERAMLGDMGANLLGALAGLWLVFTLSYTGQEIALALLALITVYGEFRSISALVEKTPGLRSLDSWGRPS